MAGITPLEGQDYVSEVIYSQDVAPQTLTLGLFVNAAGTLVEASTWASITEPVGSGYAEVTLTAGSFTVSSGGVTTFPQQVFTATGDWDADVTGYYVRTGEGTPRLLHYEYAPNPKTMTTGNVFAVDLSTDTESA